MASQNPASPSGNGGQQSSSQSSSGSKSPNGDNNYTSLLNQLLDVIRTADDASIARVVAAVRSGASHDQINRLVEEISQRIHRPSGGA